MTDAGSQEALNYYIDYLPGDNSTLPFPTFG